MHFVEHGLAPDERVRRWQRRLEPVQKRVFGGCHLTRPVVQLLTSAGFTITELDVFYEEGAPQVLGRRLSRHRHISLKSQPCRVPVLARARLPREDCLR